MESYYIAQVEILDNAFDGYVRIVSAATGEVHLHVLCAKRLVVHPASKSVEKGAGIAVMIERARVCYAIGGQFTCWRTWRLEQIDPVHGDDHLALLADRKLCGELAPDTFGYCDNDVCPNKTLAFQPPVQSQKVGDFGLMSRPLGCPRVPEFSHPSNSLTL